MRRRKGRKRCLIAGALAAILTLAPWPGSENLSLRGPDGALFGRAGRLTAQASEPEADQGALGRYLETNLQLPEEVGTSGLGVIYDIRRLEDQRLRIITQNRSDRGICLYDTADLGESWEKAAELSIDPEEYYFLDFALRPDGGGAGVCMVTGDASYAFRFFSFEPGGEAQVMEFPGEQVSRVAFSDSAELIGMDGSKAYGIDPESGAVLQTFSADHVNRIAGIGDQALLLEGTQIELFDIETGEPMGREEALEEALLSGGKSYMDETSYGHRIVFASAREDGEERLYYCTHDGIFAHVIGGSVVEQAVEGSLNSLGDPTLEIIAMESAEQSFFVVCMDESGKSGILRFDYDPEIPSVPEKELRIYSLREEKDLRQSITAFQKIHPDIYINYEVGMTGEDGVTAADALRTLNTDLLAGNGPDLLLLDGMQGETYWKKGLLRDLTPLIDQVRESDGLAEQMIAPYREGEGTYAVPLGFGLMMQIGSSELVPGISDLKSIERATETGKVFSFSEAVQLPEILYYACGADWQREDQTIDEEKLAEYVHLTKQIYDNCLANEDPAYLPELLDSKDAILSFYEDTNWFYGDMFSSGLTYLQGDAPLEIGILTRMIDYAMITTAQHQVDEGTCEAFQPFGEGIFLPRCVIGILQGASEEESAEAFLSYLLSYEGNRPTSQYHTGLPVNLAALREVVYTDPFQDDTSLVFTSENTETGETFTIECTWPTREEQDHLMEMMDQCTVQANLDQVQMETVVSQARRCLEGEISEEEAVGAIMQTINLYLAENAS